MGLGLAGLLGLAGGANAIGGGLNQFASQRRADEQRQQATALQLMLAGYNPVQPTPTAQGHPLATGYAHMPMSVASVPQPGGLPDIRMTPGQYTDPSLDQSSTPGSAISSLIAPRQISGQSVGLPQDYEESPTSTLQRTLGIQKQMRDVRAPVLGDPAYATAKKAEAQAEAEGKEPSQTRQAQAAAQISVAEHAANRDYDIAHQPAERDHFTTYQDVDPETGDARTMRLNTTSGDTTPIGGGRQVGGLGARGFGQGGPLGAASGLGSLKEMHASKDYLQQFETGLLNEQPGSPSLQMFDTFRKNILDAGMHAGGGSHGAIGAAISTAMRTGAMEEMVRQNPQMARYARALSAWIVSDLNLTRNASDERARWDQIASGVLGIPMSDMPIGDRIHYVHDVIQSRNARLQGLDMAAPAVQTMLENIAKQGKPQGHAASRPSIESLIRP